MRHLLRYITAVVFVLILYMGGAGSGHAFDLKTPEYLGAGLVLGSSYDPSPTLGFALLNGVAVYDYEQIMAHPAPEALRFKFEGSIGLSDHHHPRLIAGANIFAMYYLRGLASGALHPYIEGGVGLIYTDFQVEDQGLRVNFNPQAGFGAEWHTQSGMRWFTSVRAWHASNGGLHHDNRGINGVVVQCGRMF